MSTDFTIVELEQRTREWHDWRKNGIGASEANAVMSGKDGANNLLNIKIGLAEENDFQSPAMKRGADLEDEARGAYIAKIGLEVNPTCVQSLRFPWLRASLDGISEDYTKVVEIKCGEKTYETLKESLSVPKHYYAQTQHILAVTGLQSLDFWCYSPGSEGILLPVPRDEPYIRKLLSTEETFWDKVAEHLAEHFWQNQGWVPEIIQEPIEKLEEILAIFSDTPTPSISSFPLPEDRAAIKEQQSGILAQLRPVSDGQAPPLDRPPATEQELRRLIDHLAEPEVFTQWLEWAMKYTDPAEDQESM